MAYCGTSRSRTHAGNEDRKEKSSEEESGYAWNSTVSPSCQLEAQVEMLGLSGEFGAVCWTVVN